MNFLCFKLIRVLLFSISHLILINTKELNVIQSEINHSKAKQSAKQQGIYFIKEDISSLYQPNTISLFISVIDCSLKTKLTFPSKQSDYSSNYHSLLGETKYFYQQHQSLKTKPQYNNTITNKTQTLKLDDDVFIHKSTIAYQNNTVHVFILRNQFATQFNLTKSDKRKTNMKFLDFYDLNIVINRNKDTINFDNKGNVLTPSSLNRDNRVTESEVITHIADNGYELIINNSIIKEKIDRIAMLSKVMTSLLHKEEININLYNFLLTNQVEHIKTLVEDIHKSLLPLISFPLKYSDEAFDAKLTLLSSRVNKVVEYINQFDFSSSDKAIYIAYYFFFLVLVCIGGYFTALTVKEFRIAYQRKIQ